MYDKNIINFIQSLCKEINLDSNLIKRINITIYDETNEWIGKVNPIYIENQLCFEILLQKDIIDNLQSSDYTKAQKSKSVIMHELFHCIEMATSSNNIEDWRNLYFHLPITTTRLLFLDTALHQWSEYYAYYNSAKIAERKVELSQKICTVDACNTVLYQEIQNNNLPNIQIPPTFHENYISFIHLCIQLVAHYNSTHNKIYIQEINQYSRSSLYQYYYPYIKDLANYMDNLYQTYPNWISEGALIELGYKLFSFIKIHNLWFTTSDLSDCLTLKSID